FTHQGEQELQRRRQQRPGRSDSALSVRERPCHASWQEGPASYSTASDGVDQGNAVESGNGIRICRRRKLMDVVEIVEMPEKWARRPHGVESVESARRRNVVEIRGAKWKSLKLNGN
ncbi:hypothetical protein THAOC_03209, partial [Thalassiosira oceanica]